MASDKLILLAIVALVAVQQATAFEIADCAKRSEPDAELKSIVIDACPDTTGENCEFVTGKNVTLTFQFVPTVVFIEANMEIYADGTDFPVNFYGPTDLCNTNGLRCPSKVGQMEELKFTLPILPRYKSLRTPLRFELKNQDGGRIVCVRFPVKIEDN